MDDANPREHIGANNPPPYDADVVAAHEKRLRELADAGGAWLDLGKIETEEQAGKLNDFITQARAAMKAIEDDRKAAKKPHLDAGAAVDGRFKTLTTPLDTLIGKLKRPLAAYLAEKQRAEDARKAAEREAARKAQEEADRLRREAEARNDVIAQAEGEKAAKAAEKAAKAAEKPARANVASATGGGRTMSSRTTYRAEVENVNRAFSFFRDHQFWGPKLVETMQRMAEAERRDAEGVNEIPGVKFHEERSVA